MSETLENPPTPVETTPAVPAVPEKNKMELAVAKHWKPVSAILVVILIILGGLKTYSYMTSDPHKVWEDTRQKMENVESGRVKFEATYAETLPKDSGSDMTSFFGSGEFKLSMSGEGVMALRPDKLDADFDMSTNVGTKLGSLNISLDFFTRKVDNFVYYKIDGNPFGALFGGEEDKPAEWVKIDLNDKEYKEYALLEAQKTQALDAFKKAKLMAPTKLIGTANVGGVSTWHYEAKLDKQELRNYVEQLAKITGSNDDVKQAIAMADKVEFKKLELWIGKADHLIHQVLVESNFPSVLGASTGQARSKARDARRVADVRQIQTALELFYNDNGHYPASTDGQPSKTDGGQYKFSTYIANYPQSPTPADGGCKDSNNKYFYEQLEKGESYKLDFCLGHDTSSFKAGVLRASPIGMDLIEASNAGPDNELDDVPFDGTFTLKLTLSDFNSKIKIEAPAVATEAPNAGAKSRDARRVSDVRQVQTALELFYNDYNRYPSTEKELTTPTGTGQYKTPSYLNTFPVAPSPADGTCTDEQNKYTYHATSDGKNYSLMFCVGTESGGLKSGVAEATANGLQNK